MNGSTLLLHHCCLPHCFRAGCPVALPCVRLMKQLSSLGAELELCPVLSASPASRGLLFGGTEWDPTPRKRKYSYLCIYSEDERFFLLGYCEL